MHAADPSRSERLARALDFVRSAGPIGCTTAEIQSYTGSMAPATDVSELRAAGYLIECRCEGTNGNGRRVYRYKFLGRRFV